REITVEDLLNKNSRFNLKTYFDSYMQIRGNFIGELELILCTNIGLKFEQNSNPPKLLGRNTTRHQNVNLYFEPVSDADDILGEKRFRFVSVQYKKEREEVVRELSVPLKADVKEVEEFIDRL